MGTTLAVPAGHPERPEGEDGRALLKRMNGGRHEELALWGLSHIDVSEDACALDIGCGGGANIARLLERVPQGRVCGADYSPLSVSASCEYNKVAVDAGRCEVVEATSDDLPFDDASFDVVTAFETVYYWELVPSFAEVRRVLVSGGQFLICNEDNGRDPSMAEFAKLVPNMHPYTADDFVRALAEAGLEVETVDEDERGFVAVVARKPA